MIEIREPTPSERDDGCNACRRKNEPVTAILNIVRTPPNGAFFIRFCGACFAELASSILAPAVRMTNANIQCAKCERWALDALVANEEEAARLAAALGWDIAMPGSAEEGKDLCPKCAHRPEKGSET